MSERRRGHVINISSMGVIGPPPRFSAYIASKSALEGWTRCAETEFADRKIHFTNINMPLVRTPMIGPTKAYDYTRLRSAPKKQPRWWWTRSSTNTAGSPPTWASSSKCGT